MLPKKIYVHEEKDGKDKYLIADKNIFFAADTEERIVGIYELKETKKVKLVAEVK